MEETRRSEESEAREDPEETLEPVNSEPAPTPVPETTSDGLVTDADDPELDSAGQHEAEAIVPALRAAWDERGLDPATRAVLILVLIQLLLTIDAGGLSGWSVTGFLWLFVVFGLWDRAYWALVLPLVLFTLDITLLLFGIGPRERAGFFALAPLDGFVYLIRLVAWLLIWRVRDELA